MISVSGKYSTRRVDRDWIAVENSWRVRGCGVDSGCALATIVPDTGPQSHPNSFFYRGFGTRSANVDIGIKRLSKGPAIAKDNKNEYCASRESHRSCELARIRFACFSISNEKHGWMI